MAVPGQRWANETGNFFLSIPVTKVIILIWVVSFLASLAKLPLNEYLVFDPGFLVPGVIPGIVTYPLAMGDNLFGLLLNGLMLFWFGGSLERRWSSGKYLLFLCLVNVAAAVVWETGTLIFLHGLTQLSSPWLMISSVIVAWAWLDPEQTILLYFILPLKAKWVGWITIAFLYFSAPIRGPLFFVMGFFQLGGVAAALAYVWYQKRWGWIPRRPRAPKGTPKPRNVIRHSASSPLAGLLRPFREWQRRRRVANLQRTIKFDD
ncbi:MAG: DUF1751 domain-containing protein [Armatimonadota bacterium]